MDVLVPLDLENWPRRQHFEHYRGAVPCTYSVTVEIEVTAFVTAAREAGRRAYIAQVWALATAVNAREEFRMGLTETGAPAVWSRVHPAFTVFHSERETFSCIWVEYGSDFVDFHDRAVRVIDEYAHSDVLFPQGTPPRNAFDVSSIPWTTFTGFHLNIQGGWDHFAPIFTLGGYAVRDGRVFLPLALQVHHAVADGFHAARLVEDLRTRFAETDWLG
jgi:chloramphenicol O-acetyltransferase type A